MLREIKRPAEGERSLVTFISGSPTQMRRVLEKKFELDGIRPDAFVLKPTLENILKGRFKAVRGQVGYKLEALLRIRADGRHERVPETLFGDDAELLVMGGQVGQDGGPGRHGVGGDEPAPP